MDTRKLHVGPDGYIGTEHDGYLKLVTPFREDAFRDQHRNVEKEPLENARELARRWNMHEDLVRHLDNLLCQLEDTNRATIADVEAAREMLTAHGYDDKALGALIDDNE